jgi:hypothetical protein
MFVYNKIHVYLMSTSDTDEINMLTPPLQTLPDNNLINDENQEDDVEFFECQKCSEYNIIKTKKKSRRTTRVRHIKVNSVTWASFRRFASINNVTMDYALMMLLYQARTDNMNYLVNPKSLVRKTTTRHK